MHLKMAVKNKLLTVLSEAEQYALGLLDFDDVQRLEGQVRK
jgi:hypothetical protein